MYSDRESFSSSFPSDPQESLLFAPHNEYAVDTQHLDNDQSSYGSLLEDLYVDGTTPLLDVGPGGAFDLDYSPPNYPTVHSPLYNDVPRINVNTTVTARYSDQGPSDSALLRTPMTPGIISPHATGYMSSPNTIDPSPPTPAHSLAAEGYVGVSSSPVSNGWQGRPVPEPMMFRNKPSPFSDLQLSAPQIATPVMSGPQVSPMSAHSRGPMVPQRRYRPHTSSDRRRYVEEVKLEESILFVTKYDQGISMQDAMHNRFGNLLGRDDLMFKERGPSISVRINWPGYAPWSRQIPTRDFRNPPGPITRAKLAKNVAKSVKRFIEEHQHRPMEEDGDPAWRVGRPNIDLFDLILIQLDHVSRGSWQAQLQLAHPRHMH